MVKRPPLMVIGVVVALLLQSRTTAADAPRQVVSLDGKWQVAEGKINQSPAVFNRTVPVPGLVSLATPAFADLQPRSAEYTRRAKANSISLPLSTRLIT